MPRNLTENGPESCNEVVSWRRWAGDYYYPGEGSWFRRRANQAPAHPRACEHRWISNVETSNPAPRVHNTVRLLTDRQRQAQILIHVPNSLSPGWWCASPSWIANPHTQFQVLSKYEVLDTSAILIQGPHSSINITISNIKQSVCATYLDLHSMF